jgi:hypothetical protein
MFPFTQIYNFYDWLYYEEITCSNPKCNIKFKCKKTNIKPTHCSVGCGYAEYNDIEEEKKRIKEEPKYKLFREYYKNIIREEELNKLKKEIIEDLINKKEMIREDVLGEIKKELDENKEEIIRQIIQPKKL